MLASAMWQTQELLHGKNSSVAFPALLVSLASILVVYCHAVDTHGGDPTKTFLALIVVQMLPLVFLEMKILSCPDPVSMLSRFGTKVLLMHAGFLALRVCTWPLLEVGLGMCNLAGLLCVCAALHWGFCFRLTIASAYEHRDVGGLTLLALVAAVGTELLDFQNVHSMLESTIFAASSYVEILAFVPAVWMVHQTAKKSDVMEISAGASVESQSLCFFAFLVSFYVMEDVVSAFRVYGDEPLAAAGHVVHFLLLLDFACFLLAHIYNPEKIQGQLLRWLPVSGFV
ncbi:unnamed protein product [Polarella glacialis]|uniref:Uncharacterized protein n=1 Tax=Polarella glacialis TaxID=89957 RepID=A0A813H851_POLGL|nr:unnamed protein product [Polarella glacialis]